MSTPALKKLILISGFLLLAVTAVGRTDHPSRAYCRWTCSAASLGDCFGYYPTQWRVWPVECSASVTTVCETAPFGNCFGYYPTQWRAWPVECSAFSTTPYETAPAPSPAPEKSSTPEAPQKKDDKKPRMPEPVPPKKD
jgi:hypothetical protein